MAIPDALPASQAVLAVCAHPDDESFGLGAIIAAYTDRGTPVDLVCLTRGEASTLGNDPHASLADTRSSELAAATHVLGIRTHIVDSFPDGALPTVRLELLAVSIQRAAAGRIDTLLVFDDTGITGHPDHEQATRAALLVADRLDLAVLAWALPDTLARTLNAEFGTRFVGRAPGELDLCVRVERTRQWDAIRCHHSQLHDNPVPARRLALTGATEHLRYLRRRSA